MTDDAGDAASDPGSSAVWIGREAPSLADFEKLADRAYQSLPSTFTAPLGDVAIHIEDWAEEEVLQGLGIDDPLDLMGLYQGVDLTERGVLDPTTDLTRIYLYRRAILEAWIDGEDSLDRLISHVLVHEIGHHFGLSDDDMEAIEAGV